MSPFSTYLFARPSFVEGVGRLVDFGGTLTAYNASPNSEEADAVAIYTDWRAVGHELRTAIKKQRRKTLRRAARALPQEKARVEAIESSK